MNIHLNTQFTRKNKIEEKLFMLFCLIKVLAHRHTTYLLHRSTATVKFILLLFFLWFNSNYFFILAKKSNRWSLLYKHVHTAFFIRPTIVLNIQCIKCHRKMIPYTHTHTLPKRKTDDWGQKGGKREKETNTNILERKLNDDRGKEQESEAFESKWERTEDWCGFSRNGIKKESERRAWHTAS